MSLESLERRIKKLEDTEAIKVLKRRYCAYCDDNYDLDGLASLFTEDAVWMADILAKPKAVVRYAASSKRRPRCCPSQYTWC